MQQRTPHLHDLLLRVARKPYQAKKALFAMRRRCALLGIRDPALKCKLFDTLVLPILSYGCEVWGVDTKCGAAPEALHRDFLRRLLGVRSLQQTTWS